MDNTNPFLLLSPLDTLPQKHKKRVMETIDTAKLFLDFFELFTLKQIETTTSLLNTFFSVGSSLTK